MEISLVLELLCRPYRALICCCILPRAYALGYFMAPRWGSGGDEAQTEPWALACVAKVSLTLIKVGRGAKPCAHLSLFVMGL